MKYEFNLAVWSLFLAVSWLAEPVGWGQSAGGFVVKKFMAPISDPKSGKLKAIISGKEARPNLKTGQTQVTGAILTNFNANGQVAIIVETPECVFDIKDNSITSPGALQVRSGGGQFKITGAGFSWRQSETNSPLVISNNIHTVIRRESIKSAGLDASAATNRPPTGKTDVEVFADRFEFDSQSNLAVYRGRVMATDGERLKLTCKLLTVDLPETGGRFERILAENDVLIDIKDKDQQINATGDRAVYQLSSQNEDTVMITGRPTWRTKLYQGMGELLTLKTITNYFEFNVRSNASVRLPRSILTQPNLVPTNAVASQPELNSTNQDVQIFSDEYEFKPGAALFRGHVKVDNSPDWKLSSGKLSVALPGAVMRLESIVAEEDVVINLLDKNGEGQATGEKAIYRVGNDKTGVVELSGNPAWRMKGYEGAGGLLVFNPSRKEFRASDHASLKLLTSAFLPSGSPSAESGSQLDASFSATSPLEIHSQEYDMSSNLITFKGSVQVEQPGWKLTCDQVTANVSTNGNRIERIRASGTVEMEESSVPVRPLQEVQTAKKDIMIPGGWKASPWKMTCDEMELRMSEAVNQVEEIEANGNVVVTQNDICVTGARGIYEPPSETMRLAGDPKMVRSDGAIVTARVLVLDRRNNTFEAEGNFRVEIPESALPKAALTLPKR